MSIDRPVLKGLRRGKVHWLKPEIRFGLNLAFSIERRTIFTSQFIFLPIKLVHLRKTRGRQAVTVMRYQAVSAVSGGGRGGENQARDPRSRECGGRLESPAARLK